MAKRAVAVDLDGTLLNSGRAVSSRNADALLAAAERGWTVILSTARPVRAIKWVVPDSFQHFYWAACNGAWLLRGGEILRRRELPGEIVTQLIATFAARGWAFQVEADDRMFTDSGVPDTFWGEYYPLSQLGSRDACKLLVNVASPQDARDVVDVLPSTCMAATTDQGSLVQISHAQCNKLLAVQEVLEREGVSLEDTVAFGDDNNDLPLIEAAGYGVAMGNATPELKAVADHVTLTNDEDGVAVFLSPHLLPEGLR